MRLLARNRKKLKRITIKLTEIAEEYRPKVNQYKIKFLEKIIHLT